MYVPVYTHVILLSLLLCVWFGGCETYAIVWRAEANLEWIFLSVFTWFLTLNSGHQACLPTVLFHHYLHYN